MSSTKGPGKTKQSVGLKPELGDPEASGPSVRAELYFRGSHHKALKCLVCISVHFPIHATFPLLLEKNIKRNLISFYVSEWCMPHWCRCLRRPEEGIRRPGVGAQGGVGCAGAGLESWGLLSGFYPFHLL